MTEQTELQSGDLLPKSLEELREWLDSSKDDLEENEVVVIDSQGYENIMELGEFESDGHSIFKAGQCLGFAVALAEHFGTRTLAVSTDRPGVDGELMVRHCYALDTEGVYWDISGSWSRSEIYFGEGGGVQDMSSAEAERIVAPHLPPQHMEYARSVVEPFLDWQSE